jgi:hypothetical protein
MVKVLMLAAVLLAASAASAQEAEDLPEGKGRDETIAFCGGCHSMNLVRAQGMSRTRWNETMEWMVERHGMARIEGEDRELILDYLAESFPPRRSGRGRPNPFLKN